MGWDGPRAPGRWLCRHGPGHPHDTAPSPPQAPWHGGGLLLWFGGGGAEATDVWGCEIGLPFGPLFLKFHLFCESVCSDVIGWAPQNEAVRDSAPPPPPPGHSAGAGAPGVTNAAALSGGTTVPLPLHCPPPPPPEAQRKGEKAPSPRPHWGTRTTGVSGGSGGGVRDNVLMGADQRRRRTRVLLPWEINGPWQALPLHPRAIAGPWRGRPDCCGKPPSPSVQRVCVWSTPLCCHPLTACGDHGHGYPLPRFVNPPPPKKSRFWGEGGPGGVTWPLRALVGLPGSRRTYISLRPTVMTVGLQWGYLTPPPLWTRISLWEKMKFYKRKC